MKQIIYLTAVIVALVSLCFFLPAASNAQESETIRVASASICKDVVNRDTVDPGFSFKAEVAKLYCHTKIVGAQESTEVVHVWNYGDVERARVTLAVNGSSWRTYSSKIIQAHEIGAWHVDVIDASGHLLETIWFSVTQ